MAVGKEIRGKIKSVEGTKKITKAMEMVSASKMRKAQERMRQARPYADKVRNIAANLSQANPEYKLALHAHGRHGQGGRPHRRHHRQGPVRRPEHQHPARGDQTACASWQAAGVSTQAVAIGNKGLGFLNRIGAKVISHVVQLGDAPPLDRLIGPVKVMLDAFVAGEVDSVHLCYTRFINTMKQEPVIEQLLPLSAERLQQTQEEKAAYGWDYIYEPDAASVIDELLTRYVEALVYQAVAENMASEQSARMVAMKAATDNAGNLIDELKLIYNKTRQAAITKELSEIVGGAAAV